MHNNYNREHTKKLKIVGVEGSGEWRRTENIKKLKAAELEFLDHWVLDHKKITSVIYHVIPNVLFSVYALSVYVLVVF